MYGDTAYFDRILVDDCAKRVGLLAHARCLQRQLGAQPFDLIYNLQGSSLAHLLVLLLRKRRVINKSSSLWHKLLSIKVVGKSVPELVGAGGFDQRVVTDYFQQEKSTVIQLGTDPQLAERYRQILHQDGATRPVAALAPGASPRWESKKWGDRHYTELAVRLQDAGFRVIVVGSDLESAAARLILLRADGALDFTGQTRVGELKALIGNCDVFIGTDSGPAHIAAAVGTPTVTLFAATRSSHGVQHHPYRGEHISLSAAGDVCQVCYNPHCPKSHACMATIRVDSVLQAALRLAHQHPARLR